jgi:hypothetical protein
LIECFAAASLVADPLANVEADLPAGYSEADDRRSSSTKLLRAWKRCDAAYHTAPGIQGRAWGLPEFLPAVVAQAREITEAEDSARVPEVATLGHKEGTKFRPLRNVAKMIRKIVEAPGVEPGQRFQKTSMSAPTCTIVAASFRFRNASGESR